MTKRAIEKAMYAPHELTPAEREFTRGIRPVWEDGLEMRSLPPEESDDGAEMTENDRDRAIRDAATDFVW